MSNLNNFNFNKLDLRLSNSDYWDFFIANDDFFGNGVDLTSPDCFVVHYDFNQLATYENNSLSANTILSLVTWADATNTGYTFDTIGLTGIDNGLITFDKSLSDTSNQELLLALTGSTLLIPAGDNRLQMSKVTGTTADIKYPIKIISGTTIYAQLCGGFYQGYYKIDGYSYEVLPTRVNQAWVAEFWLNPQDICVPSGTILNDIYPNNKGFFFYMGTRAENKFWNIWEGADTGCTKDCTIPNGCTDILSEWCTIPKETDISFVGDYNVLIPLSPPQLEINLITNPFLVYGRATSKPYQGTSGSSATFLGDENGNFIVSENNDYILAEPSTLFNNSNEPTAVSSTGNTCNCSSCKSSGDGLGSQTICTYKKNGIVVVKQKKRITNTQNPFLIYGRSNAGQSCRCSSCSDTSDGLANQTICTFSGFTSTIDELDNKVDVIDNALGFRIKDDGSIGYRLLTYTGQCITDTVGIQTYVSGATIEEAYSEPDMVKPDEWSYVTIRFVTDYKDDCELKSTKARKGKLMFYVNAKLKFVVNDFDEFIAKRLNEYKDKQIGVPFNMSLGGGSQGLLESQTFDGLDPNDRGLLIEKNFAGTFIGGIEQFKFNICDLNYNDIQYNYNLGLTSMEAILIKSPSGYYYGKLSTNFITLNDVNNLTFTLGNEIVNNYLTFSSNTNSYSYILIPSDFTQPTNFKNSHFGCQGFDVPYIQLSDITIVDNNGFDIIYNVYRTYNKTNGILDIWFCN
jgi:hypothetical protein